MSSADAKNNNKNNKKCFGSRFAYQELKIKTDELNRENKTKDNEVKNEFIRGKIMLNKLKEATENTSKALSNHSELIIKKNMLIHDSSSILQEHVSFLQDMARNEISNKSVWIKNLCEMHNEIEEQMHILLSLNKTLMKITLDFEEKGGEEEEEEEPRYTNITTTTIINSYDQ